ncbi:IS200/IS605 family transposase [Armatimonas sp.]|uniref:IS200/IS605 family transposase n=2 Tax=Armatimonas sp. TaxID=1872638 RepID=UPI00286A06BA|nr:IS200/IS605 family transposase [Armatimonas sp.]
MSSCVRHIFLHFVWATRERQPFVTPEIERRLYRMMEAKVRELGCIVVALNGMPDHVHLLVQMSTTITPADLMQKVKGASSGFARNVLKQGELFAWQHGYGVFSVGQDGVGAVVAYIANQKQHHADHDVWDNWEHIPITPETDLSAEGAARSAP